ncbi:MAG: DUF4019 domain-containing protein [Novosphingobium sp.]|uniref:helix-turn-helix domain-containing protein n=1 Tax=Novosphingobium sp. TaxID=1874826 RepID=UPI003C7E9D42
MTHGYQALTEKEKETLRLLVNGYDAKSMARCLGLSVHTVNERLRDARRKMAVSSSREAARQLRELESASPELLGDKALGDASTPAAGQMVPRPAQGVGSWRRTGWIIGAFAMTISLALLALTALSGPSQTPAAAMSGPAEIAATRTSQQAAVDAAQQFLALCDSDDWTASWQAAHQSFKLLNTVEWWTKVSSGLRAELGTIEARELVTADFTPAPPHGAWVIRFKARYSKGGAVVEAVSLSEESGTWKVTGIMID